MILYLVRHPETELNSTQGIFFGQSESSYTPRGYDQFDEILKFFKNTRLDFVYCSGIFRAHRLAEAVARIHMIGCWIFPGLSERNFGQWEGKTYGEVGIDWKSLPADLCPPGGESEEQFAQRIYGIAEKVVEQLKETERIVAVFSHWGVITNILKFLGVEFEDIDLASITILEVNHELVKPIIVNRTLPFKLCKKMTNVS